MIKNYIIIAFRSLLKYKTTSIINILGLTLGLASALLAIMYALHELSYEKCHEKADRICMVYLNGKMGNLSWVPVNLGPEGKTIKEMFPEVESYSIQRSTDGVVKFGDNIFKEDNILFADSTFYSILTIPFLNGKPQFDPQSVSISDRTASKYFGKLNPIGKLLTVDCLGEKLVFTVTGVYKNLPTYTEIKADIIAPFSLANRLGWEYDKYQSSNYQNLVLLKPVTDVKKLNAKIATSYKIPIPIPDIRATLMPLKQIHMRGTFDNNFGKLLSFLIGGLFVLITSCFNYVNLTNILFSTRIKEIGIRKVNGASRKNMFVQFMSDVALATLIAFNLAIVILVFALPWFNSIMDTNLSINMSLNFIIIVTGLFFTTVIVSGILPSFKYAALKPVSLFQTNISGITTKNRTLWILTTVQFLLAVLFIQVMLVMHKQNNYFNKLDVLGYNSNDLICLQGNQWGDLEKIKNELLKNPSISNVSWGSSLPQINMSMTPNWKDDKNQEPALIATMDVNYAAIFGIKIIDGRFFSKDFPSDKEDAMVINKKAVDILGYKKPVGQKMMAQGKQYTIIGIIDSYQASPPIFSELPQIIYQSKNTDEYLIIKTDPRNCKSAHESIIKILRQFNPNYPVDIKYHSDFLIESAKSYISSAYLIRLFFILTIFTSLIGLFALSVFIAEKSRKVVSIRKIFGASIITVLRGLLKGILYQVCVAICIATPIAIIISQKYLELFPKHYSPNLFLYLFGGLIALTITMLTVSWQALRATNRNPAEALRYE